MLTLALVIRNPSGDAAVSLIGIAIIAILAAALIGLWIFVAGKAAHAEDDREDPAALSRLRKWPLVVRRPRSAPAPGTPVASELDRAGPSKPAPR